MIYFVTKSNHHRELRKQNCTSQTLKRIHLIITAVPDVFPLLPQYLSSNASATRPTTSSTSAARLINENIRITKQANLLFERKNVKNLLGSSKER